MTVRRLLKAIAIVSILQCIAVGFSVYALGGHLKSEIVKAAPATSSVTPLANEVGNAFAPDVRSFFERHEGAAGMVIATVTADGGVHILTASRDPNTRPSALLGKAIGEMQAITPTVDGNAQKSHPLHTASPGLDL